jgi:hypothetical protein
MFLLCFRITHTVILDDPFDDPPGLQIPDCSPELSPEALMVSVRCNWLVTTSVEFMKDTLKGYELYKIQNLTTVSETELNLL